MQSIIKLDSSLDLKNQQSYIIYSFVYFCRISSICQKTVPYNISDDQISLKNIS